LIVTQSDIIPVSSLVKGKELNEKAKDFLAQLSEVNKHTNTPKFTRAEVQRTGRVLYDLVFGPIASTLKKHHIRPSVLMWYLDGGLRYVPVAAFYDGKQYLAERHRAMGNVFCPPSESLTLTFE
jgi:CHAT domain-containing protein